MAEATAEQVARLEERLRIVSEVTRSFAEATPDYERLLDTIARTLSEVNSGICTVLLLSEGGETVDPVAVHAPDAEALRVVRAMFAGNPIRIAEHSGIREVLRTATALLTARVDPEKLRSSLSETRYEVQKRLGVHSRVWAPLRLRGESIGVLTVGRFRADGRSFDEFDRDFIQLLADHAALAIGNARLYASERVARTAAETAERALGAAEAEYRRMLATAAEGIVMTDASGRIVYANQMMDRVFGFETGELPGLSIDTLVPHRLRGAHAEARAEYAAAPSPRPMGPDRKVVGRRKDGTEFPIEVVLSSMTREGSPVFVAFLTDITRRRASEERLREYQEKLQRMAFDAAVVEERERRRIAVELHDRIGQQLALAQISLSSVLAEVGTSPRAAIDKAIALLQESVVATRSLVFELSPPVLYDLGIKDAVSWLIEEVEKRHEMRVVLTADDADKPLDDTTAAIVFRAVRELLMNALKHARSLEVKVSLRRTEDYLEVVVADEGVGFEPEAVTSRPNGGFGLFSLREQINSLGGTLAITSARGQGTSACVRVRLKGAG